MTQQHLIQLLLPLYDNDKQPIAREELDAVRAELVEEFGGVTVFVRSPAVGVWKDDDEETVRDDVIIYEVMADQIHSGWWDVFRKGLEQRFQQKEIIIRAMSIEKL